MIELNGSLSLDDVVEVACNGEQVTLAADAATAMEETRRVVESVIETNEKQVYGLNTGFGKLQDVAISRENLERLQENIIRSHAAAVGDPAPTPVVRAAMLSRANTLAAGRSGVRPALVEQFLDLLNSNIHPLVPLEGSTDDLGANGHFGRVLLGEGRVEYQHEEMDAAEAFADAGLEPLSLAPKEGLSTLSGTPIMTGLIAIALDELERLLTAADAVAALTFSLIGNCPETFAERVVAERPQEGHQTAAQNVRRLLSDDVGIESMEQDPLSLRLIPQLHGTTRMQLENARNVVETELESVTDNPLVYPDGELVSCGNFNGQPLAESADQLARSLTKLAEASDQRTHKLLHSDNVPAPFLADEPGLESGLMIAQYTATGLVNESRLLDSAGDHSVIVSGGQEDVHSMGTIAARNLHTVMENVALVIAIELLTAVQFASLADDPPLSERLTALVDVVSEDVPLPNGDVHLHDKIEAIAELLRDGTIQSVIDAEE
ncbi:histidine ammonia-lyase [Halogranum rubrum]|uniref:Histidine ammonia-lyase n=1 Tax=Halogranum rubrum TaxID=553466 RepID=A0A1I4HWM0_9EURY|nr:aromatic amino acid lyase [Halogranum rubrum]SFL46123.1 histidine ammonia-lyase [Halogranum rubrum]